MRKGLVPLLDEEQEAFIAQTQGHAEAQTAMALNSKAKHAERYEFRDKDAFTRAYCSLDASNLARFQCMHW